MAGSPPITLHPSGYMWGVAVRAAAHHGFKFSLQCESAFKAMIQSVLKTHNIGLHEFTGRKAEAQGNVERLVQAMIDAQLTQDPAVGILDEWTILHALNKGKLCPGLWPIC